MNVVGLHPEELFDKWVHGRLTAAEGARLQAHLETCAACRFELEVRRDFAEAPREMQSSAPVILPGPIERSAPSSEVSYRARRRSRRPVWLLALAAALVAGASVAALGTGIGDFVRRTPVGAFLAKTAPETVAARSRPVARAAERPTTIPPQVSPAAGHEEVQAAVPLDELPVASIPVPRTSDAHLADGAQTPTALFRAANEARRAGDDERAIVLYRALEARFPSSEEARLSHATLGRLMLDRGDAKLALGDFDEYLSHGGTALGEEALVGRALALGKLGDRDAEIASWREVLRRFPKSIHARLARNRLAALGEL